MKKALEFIAFVMGLIFIWGFSGIMGWGFDPGWHVNNGLWMLSYHGILHRDNFTWMAPQTVWANTEWGFDLIVGWIYSIAGWPGDRWLVVVVYGGIFGLIFWQSRLNICEYFWVWLIALFLLSTGATIRPQIFSYLFFTIALIGILREWNLSLLSLIIIPWNNTHASAILWFGLLAIETLVHENKKSLWKPWLISLLGYLISPNNIGAVLSFIKMQGNALSLLIPEYQSPNFHVCYSWLILGILLIVGYQTVKKGNLRSQLWSLAGIIAYLLSQRFGIYSVIIALLLLDLPDFKYKKINTIIAVTTTLIFMTLCGSYIYQPWVQPVEYQAAQYLKSIHATHILNQYEYGSTLEMEGLTPICDGRDIWLGQQWYDHYFEASVGQYPFNKLLKEDIPKARYAVFPLKSVIAYQIQELPGWKEIYHDAKVGVWKKA